jgi:antitoxin CptB
MKELDVLLRRYVEERLAGAPVARQAAFERLLALPDPQIADYLLGYVTPPDADLTDLVRAILAK